MTWKRHFCSARRRDGEPCGNPSSDGRGGWCYVHRRQAEERARLARIAAKKREAESKSVVLPDGCVGGHSPDLVNCELGVDWP